MEGRWLTVCVYTTGSAGRCASCRIIAAAIRSNDGLKLTDDTVATNIVIFSTESLGLSAADFAGDLRQRGVLLSVVGRYDVRAVTHLDVNETAVRPTTPLSCAKPPC